MNPHKLLYMFLTHYELVKFMNAFIINFFYGKQHM